MRKQALVSELSDAYNSVRHSTAGEIGSVAAQLASNVGGPAGFIGAGISGADALSDLHKGNYGSAALNAGIAGLSFIPGGNIAGKTIGKGLQWAGKAMGLGRAAPALARTGQAIGSVLKPTTTGAHVANTVGMLGAGTLAQNYDANQAMARPTNQLAMLNAQKDRDDMNEWRKHKQTLQGYGQGYEQGYAPKQAEAPVIAPHSYSDIMQHGMGTSKAIAPYLLAANLAMHTHPHIKNEDVGGTAKGVLEGGAATAGALGGIPVGAVGGAALGKLVAQLGGLNAGRSMLNGAALGSVAGGYAGHRLGQAVPGALAEGGASLLSPKYGSYKQALDIPGAIKTFGRGIKAMGVGAQSIAREPHLMDNPGLAKILSPLGRAAYGTGNLIEKTPGAVAGALEKGRQPIRQAGEWLSRKGSQMSEPTQARNTMENTLQRQARDVETFNTKLKNSPAGESWHTNNGNIGGAEYTGKDMKELGNKAYTERLGEMGIGGKMKHYGGMGMQAAGNFAQKSPLTAAGIAGLGVAGAGAMGTQAISGKKKDDDDEPAADKLKLASLKAAGIAYPQAIGTSISETPVKPGLLSTPKGKLGIAGTIGALGLGAYMAGRGKRNDEDKAALKEIDRQGYKYNG